MKFLGQFTLNMLTFKITVEDEMKSFPIYQYLNDVLQLKSRLNNLPKLR